MAMSEVLRARVPRELKEAVEVRASRLGVKPSYWLRVTLATALECQADGGQLARRDQGMEVGHEGT